MDKIIGVEDMLTEIDKLDKNIHIGHVGDLEVHIRNTIGAREFFEFVNMVYYACCDESTGRYAPEIYDAVFLVEFLDYFTDITVPKDPIEAYDMACVAELDRLYNLASESQLKNLRKAIERKMLFFEQKQLNDISNKAAQVVDLLGELVDNLGKSLDGINSENISELLKSISEFTSDDKKVLKTVTGTIDK